MNTKPRHPGADYTTSQGLRSLLTRLHEAGPGAWEHDPAAQELMAFAAEKYAALARKRPRPVGGRIRSVRRDAHCPLGRRSIRGA